jgi:hypothetical protein
MPPSHCRRGDFVDCLFPFAEEPSLPGPSRHIVFVRTMLKSADGSIRALVMLTTTSPRMIVRIPEGLAVRVSEASSRSLGMRNAFVIDVHRLALLPLTAEWFPDLGGSGFVIGRADDRLREAVDKRYRDMLARQPNPAVVLG